MDFSRETNVGFLREAAKLLQDKLIASEARFLEATRIAKEEEELCLRLSEELLVLKKKFFVGGRESKNKGKSPKLSRDKNLIHNESPLVNTQSSDAELDSETVLHEIDSEDLTCTKECGCTMEEMKGGFEESLEVSVIERRYVLRKHKRQKYICRQCRAIKTAPAPVKLVDSGEFSIQMAVEVANEKFNRHVPLERQVKSMAEAGLKVNSKTLYSLTEHLHNRLHPVAEAIRGEILARPSVGIDETPMKLLANDSRGYIWAICNNYGIYYKYETTRSGEVAKEILKGYRGAVMCDGYSGYDWIEKQPAMILAACWAHLRRKFHEARDFHPESDLFLEKIDELFGLEHKAQSIFELTEIRRIGSRPIILELESLIAAYRMKALPQSGLGKALIYALNQWPYLLKFLENPNVPLSNNAVERGLRGPVLGRKNFLGFRTINGADVGMTFYTIINTCKLLNLNPKDFLLDSALRSCRGQKLLTPFEYGKELESRYEEGQRGNLSNLHG